MIGEHSGTWLDDADVGHQIRLILERQREWSLATFGSAETRGPKGPLKHMVKELQKEIIPVEKIDIKEMADLFILWWDACHRTPFTWSQLMDAVEAKLVENGKRTWPPISDTPTDEAIEHVRETEKDGFDFLENLRLGIS